MKKPPHKGGFFAWRDSWPGASGRPSGGQALLDGVLGLCQFLGQVVLELLEEFGMQLQLGFPGGLVDAGHALELVGRELEAGPVQLFVARAHAEDVLGALAAIILTLENKNFFNTQGQGYLLTALAAVFIGGTSIFGGQATIVGSFVGAFIIVMIEAGLVASGVQGFWVRAVVGLVFLAAVVFHLSMEQPGRLAELRRRLGLGRSESRPQRE